MRRISPVLSNRRRITGAALLPDRESARRKGTGGGATARRFPIPVLIAGVFLLASFAVFAPSFGADPLSIFIIDDEKTLYLYEGEAPVASFACETGLGGMGKTGEGDMKTPVGRYTIIWMASRRGDNGRPGTHPIVDGQTWCEDSRLYYGPDGPSDERLWTDAYGGENAVVLGLDYPNGEDVRAGRTGDCIEIHASARLKDGRLTPSAGCIKLFPADALALYNRVSVGTPVIIARTRGDVLDEYPFLANEGSR
jgi:hypothetical protein